MSRFGRFSQIPAFLAILLYSSPGAAQEGAQTLAFEAPAPQERFIPAGTLRILVPDFVDNGSSEELGYLRSALPQLLRVSLLSNPGIVFVEDAAAGEPPNQEEVTVYDADLLLRGSYFYYQG